jgi:HPt (histidine-containing phosphotransfer) domain-containing protein
MNELPIFNQNVLLELSAELGLDGTREVLKIFLTDTSHKIARLATDRLSRSGVIHEAHAIKSSAATFGFERLAKLSFVLEADAENMDDAHLAASIGALCKAFSETSNLATNELLDGTGEISR